MRISELQQDYGEGWEGVADFEYAIRREVQLLGAQSYLLVAMGIPIIRDALERMDTPRMREVLNELTNHVASMHEASTSMNSVRKISRASSRALVRSRFLAWQVHGVLKERDDTYVSYASPQEIRDALTSTAWKRATGG